MGFLDSKTRVIDMVLTSVGKELLAKGELNFTYWVPFDDEVDYNPYVANSGSLTALEVTSSKTTQTENGPIGEARTGFKASNAVLLDRTNVYRPLFTVPQGQTVIPKVVKDYRTGSSDINIKEQKVVDIFKNSSIDRQYNHQEATTRTYTYSYTPHSFPDEYNLDGFRISVYASGTDGLSKIEPQQDSNKNIAFKADLNILLNRGKK